MIAALPMYDRPETAEAHDALWSLMHRGLGSHAPERLDRSRPAQALWADPGLMFGQICGLPFCTEYTQQLAIVGTGDYRLEKTPPGYYRSFLVVRRVETRGELAAFAGARLATNSHDSQSGWAAPMAAAKAGCIRFGGLLVTGSHRASARAVARGEADIAAIDAISWRGIERHDAWAADVRVLARTPATPAPPFVVPRGRDPAVARQALVDALADLPAERRHTLGLYGIVDIHLQEYLSAYAVAAE